MSVQIPSNLVYGFNQALTEAFPPPIISLRNPTTSDKTQIGRGWINTSANDAFVLTSIVNNSATWINVGGGGGTFTSLTVTPGPTNITGITNINVTGGVGFITNIGSVGGTPGNTNISGQEINLASVADITLDGAADTNVWAGANVNIGTFTATAVNIGTGNTCPINIGNTTGNTAVTGELTASGNIVSTGGNLLGTALQLAGPISVLTGAGAPSAGLAVQVGDVYINTTAASATTRMYIATAASTWTNFTCAA